MIHFPKRSDSLPAAAAPGPTAQKPAGIDADGYDAVGRLLAGSLPALVAFCTGATLLAALFLLLVWQSGGVVTLLSALQSEQSAWYLSRASAFAAFALVWWSMVLGLSITSRTARLWPGGPVAVELHEHASLLGLAFGLFHALILLADRYIGYTLGGILLPFASGDYRPVWVGLGQVGLWLAALLTGRFYVRRQIGQRVWRVIHFGSFLLFALVLVHGVMSGSDTAAPWALWLYAFSGLSVAGLTGWRIVASLRKSTKQHVVQL
jgi:predicted ferric reductase